MSAIECTAVIAPRYAFPSPEAHAFLSSTRDRRGIDGPSYLLTTAGERVENAER